MSVVVRMEMPINCLECPMYDWNRQKLCCNANFDLRPIPNGGVPIPDWCPIICQLPEWHGELIERQPIIQFIEDGLNRGEYGHDQIEVITEVFVAPTIVPATNTPTETPTNTPTDTPTVPAERSET